MTEECRCVALVLAPPSLPPISLPLQRQWQALIVNWVNFPVARMGPRYRSMHATPIAGASWPDWHKFYLSQSPNLTVTLSQMNFNWTLKNPNDHWYGIVCFLPLFYYKITCLVLLVSTVMGNWKGNNNYFHFLPYRNFLNKHHKTLFQKVFSL